MSRRCRPGQRARIIGGWNAGKIVLVVRPYFGEEVDDSTWPMAIFPWVVSSLSTPLRRLCLATKQETPAKMVMVCDDCDLQPLDDDDDGLTVSIRRSQPVAIGGKAVSHG